MASALVLQLAMLDRITVLGLERSETSDVIALLSLTAIAVQPALHLVQ